MNPPPLRDPVDFIDRLVQFKGSIERIRAAGIISSVQHATSGEWESKACWNALAGPSDACGCLRGSLNEFFCEVTEASGQSSTRIPVRTPEVDGGCDSQPSGRYVQFLNTLGDMRQAQNLKRNVLVDSICRDRYDDTLRKIVDDVILESCFDLGARVAAVGDVRVTLNGELLNNVPVGGGSRGWSLQGQGDQICLEGGLTKNIDDKFEILLIPSAN